MKQINNVVIFHMNNGSVCDHLIVYPQVSVVEDGRYIPIYSKVLKLSAQVGVAQIFRIGDTLFANLEIHDNELQQVITSFPSASGITNYIGALTVLTLDYIMLTDSQINSGVPMLGAYAGAIHSIHTMTDAHAQTVTLPIGNRIVGDFLEQVPAVSVQSTECMCKSLLFGHERGCVLSQEKSNGYV